MPSPDSARVSVIVTTRDSASTVGALLESIRRQTYPEIESIVVDNASGDDTVAIAERLADVVLGGGPERSAQRNRGIAAAAGEYVLVLDADMILEPQTVAECVATGRATGATAVVVPETTIGDSFLARVRALERSCYENDPAIEAARFFAVEAVRRFGGYDEGLTGPEDWDLPARMRAAGEVVARADRARILHDEADLHLVQHVRKKFYYGKSFAPYLARHRSLGARQVSPARAALVRQAPRLFRQPLLGAAVFGLKAAEAAAGAAGLLVGIASGRRTTASPEGAPGARG